MFCTQLTLVNESVSFTEKVLKSEFLFSLIKSVAVDIKKNLKVQCHSRNEDL